MDIKDKKKILILGGAKGQVQLIREAKKEGYYVVLCDFTTDNPGIALSDKHYQVSTLDLEAVLEVAQKEEVLGVISNSEPAMSNVAIVSQKLGLTGNPVSAVEILGSKYKFRELQKRCGVYCPEHIESDEYRDFLEKVKTLTFPVIVKPSQSSASRGVTKLDDYNEEVLRDAFDRCSKLSFNHKVTCEQYIKTQNLKTIEADFFVYKNVMIRDGVFTINRTKNLPLLPILAVLPADLSKDEYDAFCDTTEKLLNEAGFIYGEVNVEGYFTEDGKPFIVEINPRQGGSGVPDQVKLYCGIDLNRLLVTTCMGEDEYFDYVRENKLEKKNIAVDVLMPLKDGYFNGINIDKKWITYVEKLTTHEIGSKVTSATSLSDSVGVLFMGFNERKKQLEFIENVDEIVSVLVSDKPLDEKSKPLVSVVCPTYNHAKWIGCCLDSILKQKTNFPFEIIVHDDASTDGTDIIIKEYEKKYRDIIRPIFEDTNQYSTGIDINFLIEPYIRGRYVAFCEGDDYWNDENKLKKQVDFLESHSDYIACTHNTLVEDCHTKKSRVKFGNIDKQICFEDVVDGGITHYHASSLMVRREFFLTPKIYDEYCVGDYPQSLYLTSNGKVWYLKDVMSVYRRYSSNGSWSSKNYSKFDWYLNVTKSEAEMLRRVMQLQTKSRQKTIEKRMRHLEYEIAAEEGRFSDILNNYKDILDKRPKRIQVLMRALSKYKPIVSMYKKYRRMKFKVNRLGY